MIRKMLALFILGLFFCPFSQALTPADDYYLRSLLQGGPASIRSTSQAIYKSGTADTLVTDTLAEITLQHYPNQDRQFTDALAWSLKALGNSHNSRYRSVLQEILDKAPEKKLKKYAKAALNSLPENSSDQYIKGTINIEKEREKISEPTQIQPAANTSPSSATNKITSVMPGMSQEQAYALAGFPTSTTTHITGKQFIPYNFKGGDTQRIYALYKGQGTLVFTKESRYTSTWQVLEVIINTNETGYP